VRIPCVRTFYRGTVVDGITLPYQTDYL